MSKVKRLIIPMILLPSIFINTYVSVLAMEMKNSLAKSESMHQEGKMLPKEFLDDLNDLVDLALRYFLSDSKCENMRMTLNEKDLNDLEEFWSKCDVYRMRIKECTDPLATHFAMCSIKKVSNILNCLKCVFNIAEHYINGPTIENKWGPFALSEVYSESGQTSDNQLGGKLLNKYNKFNDYFKCISGIVTDKSIFKFKLSEALLWLISDLLGSPGYIRIVLEKDCCGKPQYATKFVSEHEFAVQNNIMVVDIEDSKNLIEHIAKGGEDALKVRDYYNSQQYFLLDSNKLMTKFKLSCVEQQSEEKNPGNQKKRYKKDRKSKIKKSEKKEEKKTKEVGKIEKKD